VTRKIFHGFSCGAGGEVLDLVAFGATARLGQSGDNEPELRITKAGDRLLRKTLVECEHYMVGPMETRRGVWLGTESRPG